MGWEKRNNQYYYYRKKRVNGRIRSEYVGRGAFAKLEIRLIEDARLGREIDREELRRVQQQDREIDQQLATAGAALSALTNARLYADGYHKHKGQWRKKR